MVITQRSGPLGSGPTGPGSGYSIMPLSLISDLAKIILVMHTSKITKLQKFLESFMINTGIP